MKGLSGKTAIVTGASRGIGLAIAARLVDEGANVVITARGEEALQQAVAQLGERASFVAGKADDAAHREEVVRTTLEKHGSVDILVNNTGINPVYGKLIDVDPEVSRKIFEVNIISALEWVKLVYAAGMKESGGSIVNVASVAGLRPAPGIAMYGVSKAAVVHLTEELAVELGPKIRVNAVAPAVVKTKFAEALYAGREEQVSAPYPLKRLGEPDDIGSVVAFLASDDSSWMTGQTITVDGGVLLAGGI
ncbi:SDR family oxidoreductase [Yimella sp. cx-51]|uniref:SDR family oxidoreductase n=1 Tax=Yimella sp. cx-51 TaxID=2770551 RepID=UPI00165DB66D|nr:SDR family oxidoreductase [Yimella sp. cx-51]MBC9956246.1 SDR family oxidoreductase [Yimella sp. cx-51]QTH38608.1 SDR family oxidoreductase [Yimella sp. cx-51]